MITSSMPSGVSSSANLHEPPAIDKPNVLIEVTLALLTAHLFVYVILRKYYLAPLGLQYWTRPTTLLLLLLLGLRVWRNEDQLSAGARSWVPGYWLGRIRWPDLILTAPLFLSLNLLEPSGADIGVDTWYVHALRTAMMEGRLDLSNYRPGLILVWGPFFAIAHLLVLSARAFGAPLAADGFSVPYLNALRLGSLLCAFLAAALAYRCCRRYFHPYLAALGVVGVWLGSTLWFYSVYEPAMAHAPAAAAASLFLLLWLRVREDPSAPTKWMAVAFAGLLLVSMQRYEVYFLSAPVVTALAYLKKSVGAKSPRSVWAPLATLGAFTLAVLVLLYYSLSVPAYFWAHVLPYWTRPRIGEFLFSSNGGLFAWTPVAYLAVLGLFLFRPDRALGGTLLMTLGLGVYLLASTEYWSGGWSFGCRRLTEAFPIFTLGFCAAGAWTLRRPRLLAFGALVALVLWNLSLTSQIRTGVLPRGQTVSFTEAAQNAVADYSEHVGNPSSFPASWIFAWIYHVSPERFDLLYGHPPIQTMAVAFGSREDAAVVGSGWSEPFQSQGGVPYRWSTGLESTLIVPLGASRDRRLRLRGAASWTHQNRSQIIAVLVNDRSLATLTVPQRSTALEMDVPARFWKSGLNVIRFRYAWIIPARHATASGPVDSAWKLEQVALAPLAEGAPAAVSP
jgi:hypothetical protein